MPKQQAAGRQSRTWRGCVSALVVILLAHAAHAVPLVPSQIDVEIRQRVDEGDAAPDDPRAAAALAEPAFVTTVDLGARRAEAPTTADVLGEGPGVSVRTYGGLGAFTTVSIRGAGAGQTDVLVDGVPLSRLLFSSVDLGGFDLATFDTIDVHRSGAPLLLSGASLGGAIVLSTVAGPTARGSDTFQLGFGSFGARRGLAAHRHAWLHGRLRATFAVSTSAANGDFAYFDDGGTPLVTSDDATRVRDNNAFRQVDGVARAAWRGDALDAHLGLRVGVREQGVPGPVGIAARHTSLDGARVVVDGGVARIQVGAASLAAGGYVVHEALTYLDREGELGLASQDSELSTLAVGGQVSGVLRPRAHDRLELAVVPRFERVTITDGLRPAGVPARAEGQRQGGAAVAAYELGLAGGRVLIAPSLRFELTETRADAATGEQGTMTPPEPRSDRELVPRLGARARPWPWLAVKGSVGRYLREPTIVELYGDRGVVVGNPELQPEHGWSGDLGVVVAPGRVARGVDRVLVEASLFAARPRELIVWSPTAARTMVPRNLAEARLAGVELAASVRVAGHVTLAANYTLLDSAQVSPMVSFDGKPLPGRPRHELSTRADGDFELAGVRLGGHVDLDWQAENPRDAANLTTQPARRLVGLGLRVAVGSVHLALEIDNLTDVRTASVPLDPPPRPGLTQTTAPVSDLLGYPLPGRSALFTLTAEL